MNIQRQEVKILQCERCADTYMKVGSVIIGMAFPRPLTASIEKEYICPKHRRSLT